MMQVATRRADRAASHAENVSDAFSPEREKASDASAPERRVAPAIRLLQIGKYYPPAAGGIEAVTAAIREQLTPFVDVTTLVANHEDGAAVESDADRPGRQLIIRSRSLGRLFSMPVCPELPSQLARHTTAAPEGQGADVLLLHHPNPMAAAAYVAARPACPLVVFYHSDIVRQRALGAACGLLTGHVLKRAAAIIVTSPRLLLNSRTLRRYREKCTVVPLAIDTDKWLPEATADGPVPPADPLYRVFVAGRTVLAVGRLVYYKGLHVLLDAVARVPEASLVVVGEGPLAGPLAAQAARLGIADRVHFAGRVPDQRLRGYYRGADVFVLASTEPSEAFGLVQLEAMAAGTPVVSTNLKTGVPWVNRHGLTGLVVPPGDAASLATAVRELLDNPELARRYGGNGQRRVLRRFTLAHFRQRLLRVLQAAAGCSGGAWLRYESRRKPLLLSPVAQRTEAFVHA